MEPLAPAAKAFLEKRAARLGAKALPKPEQPGGGTSPNWIKVDVDAPVLKSIKLLTPEVDASKSNAQIQFSVEASDDFSGIARIQFQIYKEPTYSWLSVEQLVGYPLKDFKGKIGINLQGAESAGDWQIYSASILDAAGNYRYFDSAQLQQMGLPAGVRINGSSGDLQAPTVTGGKIVTPSFSLTGVQKGTLDTSIFAGFNVSLQDTGETKVSGVKSAQATFCLEEVYICVNTSAAATANGQGKLTLRTTQKSAGSSFYYAGSYRLTTLTIADFAANTRTYTNAADGGDTDFNVMFPEGTTITVTE